MNPMDKRDHPPFIGLGELIFWIVVAAVMAFTTTAFADHPASRYGIPDTGMVLERTGYIISYDGRTRQARWTLERLTAKSLKDNAERSNRFKADPDLPGEFDSELDDYAGSGYDRGHLACSANHLTTQKANDETFYLSNMSPQLPAFNRGIWKELETDVRNLIRDTAYVEVYVLTVPLFVSSGDSVRYKTIGANDVAVPTHFAKSLLCVNGEGNVSLATYILPHRDMEDYRLYRASVNELEAAAGFDCWAGLDDGDEKRLERAE